MVEENNNEERENARNAQMDYYNSDAVGNLYISAIGTDLAYSGAVGKESTMMNYLTGLSTQNDSALGNLLARPFLQMGEEYMNEKMDPRENGAVTPKMILDSVKGIYLEGIDKIKVSDVLSMMDIGNVHERRISEQEKEMYMEDYKESNRYMYQLLTKTFVSGHLNKKGLGQSIATSGEGEVRGLEAMLNSEPEEENQN